ncbi:MAG TPA: hypothetical protein VK625_06400, partial [Flavitalea sp.]|nr:hypothetical protein [Flavitalea sp.]
TFPWGGKYRFGLQYYDENGRTNGVISFVSDDDDANDFSVSTPEFAVAPSADNLPMIPIISASISHRPPTWATHFQWVRTQSLTASSYLHHITDRVQQDASYNYFSIENLNKFKDDNTGFIPGYTFVPGDRIRLITYLFPSGATFLYGTINYTIDAEILGVVDRVIATDNSDPENPVETTGKFIKFAKTFPGESYGNIILIQLYTPGNRGSDATQVFYEFGESYAISGTGANRFHRGSNQDQTASVPATFTFRDGDAYFKYRNFYTDSYSPANVYQQGIMDANYSDYWSSAVTSNGRPSVIDPSIKRQYHPGIIRFGLALQPDTNINQLNIFYPENFIETSREYGDIQKLKMRSTWLRVYFQLKVGKIPVYQRIIKDMSGNTFLTTADKLLSDIDYYTGDYGVGNTFESLAFSPFNDYWFSDIHSAFCRLGPNGIENLSEKKNLNVKSRQYAKYLRETGKKVYGVYDTKNEKYYACFEGSSTMPSLTIDFCEKKNGFNSRHGFYPEWIDSVNDLLICFIEGQIWTHDSTTVCNFFGIQQEMYIVGVANDGLLTKKDWSNITLLSDAAMDFPSITSNEKSGSLPNQTTILLETDFKYEESQFNASILRDINSPKALMGGEYIKGSVIVFTARKQNPTSAFYLNAVVVNYDESQLNKR